MNPHRKRRLNETLGDWIMRREKDLHGAALLWGFIIMAAVIIATLILALSNFLHIHGYIGG